MSSLEDPRVLFAAERTLLAWNRTSLGLIAFGFLVERAGLLAPARPEPLTLWIALGFIALGVVSALHASRQYAVLLHTLTPAEFPPGYRYRWGVVVNLVVAVLGVGLMAVLWRGG